VRALGSARLRGDGVRGWERQRLRHLCRAHPICGCCSLARRLLSDTTRFGDLVRASGRRPKGRTIAINGL